MAVAERMCDFIFMIYKGKKVLDGTLATIQNQFGQDTLRVRLEHNHHDDPCDLGAIEGVESVTDFGQLQELRMREGIDTQQLLKTLMQQGRVTHFEQTRPSLHDVFVRIARPTAEDSAIDDGHAGAEVRPGSVEDGGRAGSTSPAR